MPYKVRQNEKDGVLTLSVICHNTKQTVLDTVRQTIAMKD